jgi:hypothetical protein
MSPLHALRQGAARVRRAPGLTGGLFAALTLTMLPAALSVRQAIADDLGESALAERVATSADLDWWMEFSSRAKGAAADFVPSTKGFAGVLRNLGDLIDGSTSSQAVRVTVFASWLIGTLLSGGILDRLARDRPVHVDAFFAASAGYFFRLLRLNVTALGACLLVAWVFRRAYGLLHDSMLRDLTSERAAFAWALVFTVPALLAILAITVIADCARVRTVVEDRRSVLFAIVAGARFAWRSVAPLTGLYASLLALIAVAMLLYAVLSEFLAFSGRSLAAAAVVAELYLFARVWIKLQTYASVTALFQGALAHAGYTARPLPVWPESPAVETLGPPPSNEPS